MKIRVDFHIHSCLSPCGSLEMGTSNIIKKLKENNIKIASITDHNTINNFPAFFINGLKNDILFFPGIELQTIEEVHIVIIFPTFIEARNFFNKHLKDKINNIKANYEIFGDQPVIDENENILYEEEILLIQSLNISFDQIVKLAQNEDLIYFPSHIFADSFSLISQLGFFPPELKIKLVEISAKTDSHKLENFYKLLNNKANYITNSDSHYPNEIGKKYFIIKNNEVYKIFNNLISITNTHLNKYKNINKENFESHEKPFNILDKRHINYQDIFNLEFYNNYPEIYENILFLYYKIKKILYDDFENFILNIENFFL